MQWRPAAWLRRPLRDVAAVVFPPRCSLCLAFDPHGEFCVACDGKLTIDVRGTACPRCGGNVGPLLDSAGGCDNCRSQRFAFSSVIRVGPYRDELAHACLRIKHPHHGRLAFALGRLIVKTRLEEIAAADPDLVIPVPLHWRRRMVRGYDQSEQLARGVASVISKPMLRALKRIRHTADQMRLSATERQKNVRGAFRCRMQQRVAGKRILLVDDVLTTGSTCHQAARALRVAGAEVVVAAVVAKSGDR